MIVDKTTEGYWLARGRVEGTLLLAEGRNWRQAWDGWNELARARQQREQDKLPSLSKQV